MKYTLLALLFAGSLSQAYQKEFPLPASLDASTASTILVTVVSSGGYDKQVLENAQEDAVKFVAAEGQGTVSTSLRAALDEINARVVKAGYGAMNDNDAANMVVFVNSINAKNKN